MRRAFSESTMLEVIHFTRAHLEYGYGGGLGEYFDALGHACTAFDADEERDRAFIRSRPPARTREQMHRICVDCVRQSMVSSA